MARKEPCFAWFVVFCSFMLHLITDGVAYTFGIFFTALLEDLHSSKALAAWVPSIMTGLTYGVGPLAAALTDRYGCRTIALFGTCLTASGFAIASLAGGVFALYGSIGILAGAGFGLIYLPAVVCLTQHFTRHLALATGLAVSASGIGTALFAPVTEQLVQRFGWRIAMRCVAVMLLLSGMFALSFGSPVTSGQSTPEDSADADDDEDDDDDSRKKMVHFSHAQLPTIESSRPLVENAAKSPGNVLLRLDVDKANRFSNDLLSNKSAPVTSAAPVDLEPTEQPTTADPEQKTNMFNVSQIDHHQSHTNLSHKSHPDHANTLQQHRPPMYKSHGNLHHHHEFGLGRPEPSLLSAPIIPLDSILLYSTSLTSINYCAETYAKSSEAYSHSRRASSSTNNRDGAQLPLYFDSSHHPSHHHHHHHQHHGRSRRQSLTSTAHVPSLVSNGLVSSPSLSLKTDTPASLSHSTSIKSNHAPAQNTCRTLRALLSFNLLYEPLFVWFALSNFLTSLGYYVPHIYIKERCLVLQHPVVPEHCSYLLSLIGVSSTVGRILFGFLSDFERCNRLMLYSHCLLLCGLATTLTPFAHNYWLLGVFCIIFGLTTGAFVSLTTIILVDLLGVAKLTNAFGLLLLFQGVASLTGPPIIGLLYDLTNSYNEGFMFAGIAIGLSGFMLYFVPFLRNKASVINFR